MASRTPVTIESSPPEVVYRAPSITPDLIPRTDGTKPAIPSSPELVSPSSFVRPRAPLLKSGSRAQQVPAGANTGFASAANIWRAQEKREDASAGETRENRVEDSERRREEGRVQTKSTGKLARPKKIPKARNECVIPTTESEDAPLAEQPETPSGAVPGKDARLSPRGEASRQDDSAPRRPSMNLSRYSFDADRTSGQPDVTEKKAPAIGKPTRKRPAKSTNTGVAPTEKKPRKCKAKSAAIVLDSDEPEEALLEEMPRARRIAAQSKPRGPLTKSIASAKDDGNAGCSALEHTPTSKHDSAEQRVEEASVASAYFAQPQLTVQHHRLSASPPPPPQPAAPAEQPTEADTGRPSLIDNTTVNANIEYVLPPSDPAPRRRRSWTPAKNPSEDNTISLVNHELDEKMDQIPFAEMLGNFSYLQPDAPPAQRVVSGESSTKRRRVELSTTTHMPPPNDSNVSPPKAAPKTIKKKSKAPKKAQTITALATAAFQPAVPQEPAQSTVSAFFTPQKETSGPLATEQGVEEEVTVKAKKPRKPRAKAKTTDDVAVAAPAKTAKPRSKPKAKVKFNPADYEPPLYSPSQARKEMKSQEFLFGTSSQLAAEESPDFIREIQLAVRQSEMTHDMPSGSQPPCTQINSSQLCDERSYAKVPTAPHGTCLSVEQAHRELWSVSARDAAGAKLAQETQDITRHPPDVELGEHAIQSVEVAGRDASAESAKDSPEVAMPATSNEKLEEFNADTIDNTTALEEAGPRLPSVEPKASNLDDDWMLLRSDDSEILPQPAAIRSLERPAAMASMPARRTALQALDANVSITIQDPGTKLNAIGHIRPFSTGTLNCGTERYSADPLDTNHSAAFAPQSPSRGRGRPRKNSPQAKSPTASPARGPGRPKKATSPISRPATSPARGPGRPRKDTSPKRALATSPARGPGRPRKATAPTARPATSPARGPGRPRKDTSPRTAPTTSPARGRGRPRNETLPATQAPGSPARGRGRPRKSALVEKSPKRPVGRPRKDKSDSAAIPIRSSSKDRSSKRTISASQPELGKEWTNIDEISDSDSPATPSPRRRRASTSPARVRPLDFAYSRSPSPKPKASTSGTSSMKPTDPAWPTVQQIIYPQIFQTIKSAPSSNDMKAPSWHEKILLYDPIVLEDLTAWLNRQGLRTEVKRQKPKVKKRGRKRKDATPEVDEWEVVRDELKAWMVQKWCEDQGICCLWKEGLRGGVKARY